MDTTSRAWYKLPTWLKGKPDLVEERERAILNAMGERPWSEASALDRGSRGLRLILAGAGIAVALFLPVSFVMTYVYVHMVDPLQCAIKYQGWQQAIVSLRDRCEGAEFTVAFAWAFWVCLGAAAVSILLREFFVAQQWNRLRHLPNETLITELRARRAANLRAANWFTGSGYR